MQRLVPNYITGIILAGGRARRMHGKDKGLLAFQGKPLISHVIERLQSQLSRLCINANRNLTEYRGFGYPVFSDEWSDFNGPLAGFYSALRHCPGEWLCMVPCDVPYLPLDLIARLTAAAQQHQVPVVSVTDGEYLHGTICLLHRDCQALLLDYYQQDKHKVREWITSQPHALVDYSDQPAAFININQPQQLEAETHE